MAMKKVVLGTVLLAAASIGTASAADRNCYSPTDTEAEQALLFQTNLMVISSACRDTIYGEFRARNKDAIVRYQNAMIEHFRRTGARNPKSAFDSWQTSLANEFAQKQALTPTAQFCQQSAEMLKLASTLDQKGFHDYAVTHVVDGVHPKCTK
jgi:predicted membrane-bound mannosyltransferase